MHSLDFFWLMLIASLVAMLGRFVKIPYTIALVIAGLFVGQLGLLPDISLEPHILFTLFLPPLLFEAGIHIRFRLLSSLGVVIGLLAVGGTLLSTAIIGYGAHFLLGIPLLAALLFGAMISPTDPISVLAMFKKLGINQRLSLLVEAESLFNDGIAVVLFGVIQSVIVTQSFSLAESISSFVVTVLGGGVIGAMIGGIASRVTLAYDDHLLEITLTTIVAYGAYLAAESVHVSGVIAVVVASLVVGNYGMTVGMTQNSRVAVTSFWEYAAFVANSMVFLLVGLEIAAIPLLVSSKAIMISIVIVLIARAVSIYSLSAAAARIGQYIPASWRHILVWSGLRGALSMAMVLGIDPVVAEKNTLIPLIYGVVFFSLLGQGMTIEKLVAKLGLNQNQQEKK